MRLHHFGYSLTWRRLVIMASFHSPKLVASLSRRQFGSVQKATVAAVGTQIWEHLTGPYWALIETQTAPIFPLQPRIAFVCRGFITYTHSLTGLRATFVPTFPFLVLPLRPVRPLERLLPSSLATYYSRNGRKWVEPLTNASLTLIDALPGFALYTLSAEHHAWQEHRAEETDMRHHL